MRLSKYGTITFGSLLIIISVCQFFFTNFKLFIWKNMRKILSERERVKYQKAMAAPIALFGVIVLISSLFFYELAEIGYVIGLFVVVILVMSINKHHLGYFSYRAAIDNWQNETASESHPSDEKNG